MCDRITSVIPGTNTKKMQLQPNHAEHENYDTMEEKMIAIH